MANKNKTTMWSVIGAVVVLGAIVAGVLVMEDRYMNKADAASKTDVYQAQQTANQAVFTSTYTQIQFILTAKEAKLYELQKKWGKNPTPPSCPPEICKMIEDLKREVAQLRGQKKIMDEAAIKKAAKAAQGP